jgi:hypothetical protein
MKSTLRAIGLIGLPLLIDARDGYPQTPRSGTVLLGIVGDATNGGTFVVGAELIVRELDLHARTDIVGRARIAGIPAGTFSVEARRIGFVPLVTPVKFTGSDSVEVAFLLQPSAQILPDILIADSASSGALSEFETRRRKHIGGYFVTSAEIRRAQGSNIANLLRSKVPGINFSVSATGSTLVFSLRGSNSFKTGLCQVVVFLDGVRITNGDAGILPLELLAGIEYYPPGFAPVQYRAAAGVVSGGGLRTGGSAGCGVMLLWTRA